VFAFSYRHDILVVTQVEDDVMLKSSIETRINSEVGYTTLERPLYTTLQHYITLRVLLREGFKKQKYDFLSTFGG